MYCSHFGLREYPFLSTADRRFFYLSESQSQAKSYLQYLLEIRDGIVVLTGVSGAGKSVLLDQLLRDMPSSVSVAHLRQTLLSDEEFLLSVCMQLGCVPQLKDRPSLFDAIQQFAMDQHLTMKPVLLVIDEAQNLNPQVLEEIRLLANLEMFGRKLIQVILVGQPELELILSDLPGDAFSQLVRLKHRLEPLDKRGISEYIDYRLYVAGNDGRIVFPSELMEEILVYTGGVPRLINQLCDMMLVTAYINNSVVIDHRCLRSAIKRLAWPPYLERRHVKTSTGDTVDMRPLPLLVVRKGDTIVAKYLVNKKRMLIGRHPNLDICLDEPTVNLVHAQLVNIEQQFFIHDLNTSSATSLSGDAIKWHALNDSDRLTIGSYTLEYQLREESSGDSIEVGNDSEAETAAIA